MRRRPVASQVGAAATLILKESRNDMLPSRTSSVSTHRDARLDVARGFALIVIFIAHMPMNPLGLFTPGRFGFSDSAEIFVFCSGAAAALAFARVFDTHGLLTGSMRVGLRIWQLYWAHIAVFVLIVATNVVFDRWSGGGTSYIEGMNLKPVFGPHAGDAVVGLLTLTYVPNYFDILPMYMVLLALIPVAVVLSRYGFGAVASLVVGLWVLAQARFLELPAEPWSHRGWFFNPFSWQLIFFTGFAFARGWIPMPRYDRRLMLTAVGVLVAGLVVAWEPLASRIAYPELFLKAIAPLSEKSHAGLLRYAHFLSLAYIAFILAGEGGRRLRGPVAAVCALAGRQALAVFLTGLWLSVVCGFLPQKLGAGLPAAIAVNAGGIAVMAGVAWLVDWFKAEPWRAAVVVKREALPRLETENTIIGAR